MNVTHFAHSSHAPTYRSTSHVLTRVQVYKLVDTLEELYTVDSIGQFPTISLLPCEIIQDLREAVNEAGLQIMNVRLKGGAASHVLTTLKRESAYNDLDILFIMEQTELTMEDQHIQFHRIKDVLLNCLLDYLPPEFEHETSSLDLEMLSDAYVEKLIKVPNCWSIDLDDENPDCWSLISLRNDLGRNLEFKFVYQMKRQFVCSLDSFQIVLEPYFLQWCAFDARSKHFWSIPTGFNSTRNDLPKTQVYESRYRKWRELSNSEITALQVMTPVQSWTSLQLQTSNSRTTSHSPIDSSITCESPQPEYSLTLTTAPTSTLCLPPPKLPIQISTATPTQLADWMQASSCGATNIKPYPPSPSPPRQATLSPLSELTLSPSRLISFSPPILPTPSPPLMTTQSPDDSTGTEKSLITVTPFSPQAAPKTSSENDSIRMSMSESRTCTQKNNVENFNYSDLFMRKTHTTSTGRSRAQIANRSKLIENKLIASLPTAIALVTFDTWERAIMHLNKNIIFLYQPEGIRGGGLLKYCDLSNQQYALAAEQVMEQDVLECRMVVRFYMDFPTINVQHREIRKYIHAHFPRRTNEVESFLTVLLKIIQRSTVQTKADTIRLILNFIEKAAENGFERLPPRSDRCQMLPPHVQRRLSREIGVNSTEISQPPDYVGAICEYITGTYISQDESSYTHAQPQTKNTYINPNFMPHISCLGITGEQSTKIMPYTDIAPYLKNLHQFTNSNKTWAESLEATRALRGFGVTTAQRKYTSLSARSKHRHSRNPSFWIRNAKEHQTSVDSHHDVSQRSTNRNILYRRAHCQSDKRTGRGGQRIHRGPLEAKKRRKILPPKVMPKRAQALLRVH